MKLDKRTIENMLKNIFYTDILNKIEHCCKQSTLNVWGNSVILVNYADGQTYEFDIESWQIRVDFDYESATLDSLQEFCQSLAQKAYEYEVEQLGNRNADNCTCHLLCDWRFLENEVGGIINNGKVTLVKYAKILEDMDNAN